jgi:hypothetical protein
MKRYPVKPALTVLLALMLLTQGCSDSDSEKTKDIQKNDPRLIGTWQQTAIGKEKVSGIIVKLIFSKRTLTMEAPGCKITGDYAAAGDEFTYTVTSTQGEHCTTQQPGVNESVRYRVTGSQLFLMPLSGGEKNQTEYKRIEDNQHP